MTVFVSSTGVEKDVEFDFDAVCEYEETHPDWSLVALATKIKLLRFTDLNLMSRFLGFSGYKEFIGMGFTLNDMGEMISASKYMGFTTSTPSEEGE